MTRSKAATFSATRTRSRSWPGDAPRAIVELEHMGVPFSRNDQGKIAQRAFGGHTKEFGKAPVKRACYASDRTGRVIMDTLYEQCVKADVTFYPEQRVTDLFIGPDGCAGAALMDLSTSAITAVSAKAVLLATGGYGKIFKTTSNCFGNTGEGLFIVYRKGIPLQDMEFVQFHPTGIRKLGILISEAARGEGGILLNNEGERFMERYAPTIKDLAPRDIVSRSILSEVREGRGIGGEDYVHLDIARLGEEKVNSRLWEIASFARIYAGVEPLREPIPVQPTCHYMMGGIPTDSDGRVLSGGNGEEPVPGFFAAGECACVSVHGANRLGCNSLLDLVVFGRRAGKAIFEYVKENGKSHPDGPAGSTDDIRQKINDLQNSSGKEKAPVIRRELQEMMMDRCSVFRTEQGLEQAKEKISELIERFAGIGVENKSQAFNMELTDALDCEALLNLARVMVESALFRKESRGVHYREDYPNRDDDNFLVHTMASEGPDGPVISTKPVRITQFKPVARTY